MAGPRVLWAAGVACICFVAVIWTLATVLKQIIFSDLDFNEPLVLAYVCNGCYALHLPLFALGRSLGLVERLPWRRAAGQRDGAVGALSGGGQAAGSGSSALEAVRAGVLIAPLWFAAQWTYSAGVASTSVTSSTVISTTSVVWTLLASWLFLGERLTVGKVLGILACMAGNVATLWGSDAQPGRKERFMGDVLCLVAAMLYAAYTTLLTVLTGPETSVVLLFGSLGVTVLACGAPLLVLLRWRALQQMSLQVFGLLVFNGIFDNVLSQYAWAKAVQWTSPTTATVGLSLTIPLSIVADLVRKVGLTAWSYIAAALVIAGFLLVTLASAPDATEGAAATRGGSSSLVTPLAVADGADGVAAASKSSLGGSSTSEIPANERLGC